MNKVELTGRLTRDAEIRSSNTTPPATVARYTLAVERRYKKDDQQQADFISCIAFGKTAEFMERYGKKGVKFEVVGRIQTGSYTDRDGHKVYTTEVVCEEMGFAESKAAAERNEQAYIAQQPQGDGFMNIPDGIDDELPFS